MKIKKSELKQIIQEEIETVIAEKKWSKGQIKPQSPEHRDAIIAADPTMLDEPPRAEKAWLNRGVIDYDDDGTVKGRGGRNESQDQLYQMVQEELEAVLDEKSDRPNPYLTLHRQQRARAHKGDEPAAGGTWDAEKMIIPSGGRGDPTAYGDLAGKRYGDTDVYPDTDDRYRFERTPRLGHARAVHQSAVDALQQPLVVQPERSVSLPPYTQGPGDIKVEPPPPPPLPLEFTQETPPNTPPPLPLDLDTPPIDPFGGLPIDFDRDAGAGLHGQDGVKMPANLGTREEPVTKKAPARPSPEMGRPLGKRDAGRKADLRRRARREGLIKQMVQEELEAVIGKDQRKLNRADKKAGRQAARAARADRKIDRQVGRAERGLDRADQKAGKQAARADQKAGKQAARAARALDRADHRAARQAATPTPPHGAAAAMGDLDPDTLPDLTMTVFPPAATQGGAPHEEVTYYSNQGDEIDPPPSAPTITTPTPDLGPGGYEVKTEPRPERGGFSIGRRVYKEGLINQMVQEALQAVLAERNR